jgi:hypothetical protein
MPVIIFISYLHELVPAHLNAASFDQKIPRITHIDPYFFDFSIERRDQLCIRASD